MSKIVIEQLLYGYNNGHTLLATSLEKKLKMQNDVEVLSDSSGSGVFNEYITCYPLNDDGYYVFSKTWYAKEMKRPGCVWTHVLLVSFNDIKSLNGVVDIRSIFCKPVKNNYSNYNKKIECDTEKIKLDSDTYNYLVYTIFNTQRKIVIEDNSAKEYERTLIDIIFKLPIEILMNFSICTNSICNRYIKGEIFTFQFTPIGNARLLCKDDESIIQYKNNNEITDYPLWVRYLTNKFLLAEQQKIFEFCSIYTSVDRNSIREMSKVYYAVNEFHESIRINVYINILNKINSGEKLIAKTFELVFMEENTNVLNWFEDSDLATFVCEKLTNKDNDYMKNQIKIKALKKYAIEIYREKNNEKIQGLFNKYIHNDINEIGESFVRNLIELMKPEDLYDIFKLDYNVSIVLIKINNKFLLCKHIWRQKKDFQLEMLNCSSNKSEVNIEEILECIIKNTNENISKEVYEIYGDKLLYIITKLCSENYLFYEDQVNIWFPLFSGKKDYYKTILLRTSDLKIIKCLMKNIDSFSINDEELNTIWLSIIEKYFNELKVDEYTAFFILPIIIRGTKEISSTLTNYVFNVINIKLENSNMDYRMWRKIDSILPAVSIEQSWDKCLRLRKAFDQRNYKHD